MCGDGTGVHRAAGLKFVLGDGGHLPGYEDDIVVGVKVGVVVC